MTVWRSLVLLGACALVARAPLAAQDLAATRVGIAPLAVADGRPRAAPLEMPQATTMSHRRLQYVLEGAAVGAIAGGLLLANRIPHEPDARSIPRLTVLCIGVGAGLGALGGWALSNADWWPSSAGFRAPLPNDR
jgi:hypothetical protein